MSLISGTAYRSSPQDVAELEALLGTSLPSDYVAWALSHDAGFFSDIQAVDVPEIGRLSPVGVTALFAPSTDMQKRWHHWSRIGDQEQLPVGEGPTGDLITLKLRQPDAGSVWYWQHDLGEGAPAFTRIADCFADFVTAIHPLDLDGAP